MDTTNSSLIYVNTRSELYSDALANKNVSIAESDGGITVTANSSSDTTPGVFFGVSTSSGVNIPILQNAFITIQVIGYAEVGTTAFIYAGNGKTNYVGRTNTLDASESSTKTARFKITDPTITTIKVGVLMSHAAIGHQFTIGSFKLYQELPPVNTNYLSAQNAIVSSGFNTPTSLVTTSVTDLSNIPVATTSGCIMIIAGNAELTLPFVNVVNSSIRNGTTYRLFSVASSTAANIFIRTGDNAIGFSGTIYYNGGGLNIPTGASQLLINVDSSPGDTIDLMYYGSTWYVRGTVVAVPTANTGGEGGVAPTVISTGISSSPSDPNVLADGSITDPGSSSVISVGFCWNTEENPTIYDFHQQQAYSADDFTINITGLEPMDTPLFGKVYATNIYGPGYGAQLEFQTGLCLLRDTLIAMANGTSKMIQDIVYNDDLLVWDFDNARYSIAKPLWIKKTGKTNFFNKLTFSDGTVLNTITQHRIFNKQRGQFTYPMTDDTPIGTVTFTSNGKEIVLVSKEVCREQTEHYNIITHCHINTFANTVLTSCRYNNIYPILNMQFVKDSRDIVEYNESYGIPRMYFDGIRLGEQLIPLSESKTYVDRLIKSAVPRQILFLDHQGVIALNGNEFFDNECIQGLQKLLERCPNLDIVVSSDWKRRFNLKEMREMYRAHNLKEPIDYTPDRKHTTISGYPKGRAGEINTWLLQNAVREWACIDDLDMSAFLERFVRTDKNIGLTDRKVQTALSTLLSSERIDN